ncbi:hypothetical protein FJY93_04105 [Candidatus Kaiserbacteria bacterium]|nr:hypothetical protein [Candidatus Kaiserbacteria bacterium]
MNGKYILFAILVLATASFTVPSVWESFRWKPAISQLPDRSDIDDLVIESETMEQALANELPRELVGRTYLGMLQTCVDPKYLEALISVAYETQDINEGNRRATVLLLFLESMGKCTVKRKLHPFTVIDIQDIGLKRQVRGWASPPFNMESLGIVEVEVYSRDLSESRTLFTVVVLPGVNI